MQINFDAEQFEPSTGGGICFPLGEYLVEVTAADVVPQKNNPSTGFVEVSLTALEGPMRGMTQKDRFNIWHESEQPRKIAQSQLSALCYCIGRTKIQDTSHLVGGRCKIIAGPQEPPSEKYSEVKKYMDINGNPPKHGGQQANQGQQYQPQQQQQPVQTSFQPQQTVQPAPAQTSFPGATQNPFGAPAGGPAPVDNSNLPPWLRK